MFTIHHFIRMSKAILNTCDKEVEFFNEAYVSISGGYIKLREL